MSDFMKKWEKERDGGMWRYFIRHLPGMLALLAGAVLGTCLLRREFPASVSVVDFCIGVAIIFAIFLLSWLMNEWRYRGEKSDAQKRGRTHKHKETGR